MQSISARVYGCCGALQHVLRAPFLHQLRPRNITATRSASPPMMEKLCVMSKMLMPVRAFDLLHQLDDLPLHGRVERGGRLIGDEQPRTTRERHGDHHPLRHAAAEFVRIRAEPPRRFGDAHLRQRADDLGVLRRGGRDPLPGDAAAAPRPSAAAR